MPKAKAEAEVVYEIIKRAIVEQALAPDTKLPEELISQQFNASRHAVRTALQMLAADELVQIRQNRGATVARPTVEHGKDVLRVRMELEDIVVRAVAGKLSSKQIDELRQSIQLEYQYLDKDPASYKGQTCKFHRMLAGMANSKILLKYLDPLLSQSSLVFYTYGRPGWTKCNSDEHAELVEILEAGDVEQARSIMHQHLQSIYERAFSENKLDDVHSLEDTLNRYMEQK